MTRAGSTGYLRPVTPTYAWVQHFVTIWRRRAPLDFVLANGSLSTTTSGEGEIRRKLVEADLVDCIVAMPSQFILQHPDPGESMVRCQEPRESRSPRPTRDSLVHRRPQSRSNGDSYGSNTRRLRHLANSLPLITPGEARGTRRTMRTSRDSAKPPRSKRLQNATTSSLRAVTSAQRSWSQTLNQSKRSSAAPKSTLRRVRRGRSPTAGHP